MFYVVVTRRVRTRCSTSRADFPSHINYVAQLNLVDVIYKGDVLLVCYKVELVLCEIIDSTPLTLHSDFKRALSLRIDVMWD